MEGGLLVVICYSTWASRLGRVFIVGSTEVGPARGSRLYMTRCSNPIQSGRHRSHFQRCGDRGDSQRLELLIDLFGRAGRGLLHPPAQQP